jgi:GNAT superfamily N-acetyltransferase
VTGLAADNRSVRTFEVRPVTADRWPDMVELFGANGASSGCWCMWFRVPSRVFSSNGNSGNRAAMQAQVKRDEVPGLLAYEAGVPVGWVSVAPRRDFARMEPRADRGIVSEEGVWSVVCFYIASGRRGEGIASALLSSAVEFARANGARALEAYPVDRATPISNGDAYTGVVSLYAKAGFREVGRFDRWAAIPDVAGGDPKPLVRPPGRPVMRLEL